MIAIIIIAAATVSVTSLLWSLLIGTVLPGLTALITHESASARIKALLTALFAGVTGALAGFLITPPHGWVEWQQVVSAIAVAWITAIISYVGGWKPTGASVYVARKTARFGLGRPPSMAASTATA